MWRLVSLLFESFPSFRGIFISIQRVPAAFIAIRTALLAGRNIWNIRYIRHLLLEGGWICCFVQLEFVYLERAIHIFRNSHRSTSIVKLAAVVWCWENGNKASIGKKFISILYYLMSSCNQIQIQFLANIHNNILPKCVRCATSVRLPTFHPLIRIRPANISEYIKSARYFF